MSLQDRMIAEAMAAFAAVGGLVHNLPALATLLAVVWYALQIWDRFRGPRRPK